MKTVYRVEHIKTRLGPYTHPNRDPMNYHLIELMRTEHTNADTPGGMQDFICILCKDIFGFDSLEKLYTWFDKWLDYLIEMGFVVNEYQTEYMVESKSKKQILFDKSKSTFIRTIK